MRFVRLHCLDRLPALSHGPGMTRSYRSSNLWLASGLLLLGACSDDSGKPSTNDDDDTDQGGDDGDDMDASQSDAAVRRDAGSDAGRRADAGASDARVADAASELDAEVNGGGDDMDASTTDAATPTKDASTLDASAADAATDARVGDAGDASANDAGDAGSDAAVATCGGDTPYGCFTADNANDDACPDTTPEGRQGTDIACTPPPGTFPLPGILTCSYNRPANRNNLPRTVDCSCIGNPLDANAVVNWNCNP